MPSQRIRMQRKRCPHCGKLFDRYWLPKHIDKCKKG
jgi:hypothetical protein